MLDIEELNNMKILIVDDQSDNLKVLYKTLETAGYEMSLARTGQQALDYIQELQPDLILLDIILPDINGFEICQSIKKHEATKNIPVIFMSACLESADVVAGFDAGGVDYIRKPFVEAEVMARVRNHLTLKSLQENLERQVANRTAALSKAKILAESASREKSTFLSRMSHELRTPLNAIIGFSTLQDRYFDENSHENLKSSRKSILEAGKHLLKMIDDILDLVKIEHNKQDIPIEDVGLDELIQSSLSLVENQATENNITINYESTSLTVMGNSRRLTQVLVNLISNAIKYNQDLGCIYVRALSIGSDQVRLEVEDTGVGLETSDYDTVFAPFSRLDYAEKNAIEGSGIGLTLSRFLVEQMHGTIGFDSVKNKGSVFWLLMPKGQAPDLQVPKQIEQFALPNDVEHTVLYIDDNLPSRELFQMMLECYPGVKLNLASTAESGIEIAKSEIPDLIFFDINLPGMSGLDAISALKKDSKFKETRMVALSADALPTQIENAMKAGFTHYLTKPVDPNLIIKEINKL